MANMIVRGSQAGDALRAAARTAMAGVVAALAFGDGASAQSIGIPLRGEAPKSSPPKSTRPAPAPSRVASRPPRRAKRGAPYKTKAPHFKAIYVVGERAITGFDLEQRARLVEFSAGRRVDNVEKIALKQLIDDELKLGEADRQKISIDEKVLQDAYQNVLKRNRLTDQAFRKSLAAAGIEREYFDRQLKADLAWGRVLRARFGDRLDPGEGEVESALEKAPKGGGETRYDVRQILVAVSPKAPTPAVRAAGRKAIEAHKAATDCRKLSALAPRYGQGSGKVGVLTAKQMPPPVRAIVTKMKVGDRTRPMRSRQGFHVIMLCGVSSGGPQLSKKQIESRLRAQRLSRFSDSHLAEIRRTTVIEKR